MRIHGGVIWWAGFWLCPPWFAFRCGWSSKSAPQKELCERYDPDYWWYSKHILNLCAVFLMVVFPPRVAHSETYNRLSGLTQNKERTREFTGYLCSRGWTDNALQSWLCACWCWGLQMLVLGSARKNFTSLNNSSLLCMQQQEGVYSLKWFYFSISVSSVSVYFLFVCLIRA